MSITVNNKDLGGVTAYAAAVAAGYQGTEEQFEQLMANYASVGQEAAASASAAAVSATAAAASETAAAASAQSAATSVQGAVKYNETQTLTDAQQGVARGNIGAASAQDETATRAIVANLKSALNSVISKVGGYESIDPGTPQDGYYAVSSGQLSYVASSGSHAWHLDMSDYIGQQVIVKFVTTATNSSRRTAMCNSTGSVSVSYEEKYMTESGWTFDITSAYHDLYISFDTTKSSDLTVNVPIDGTLTNDVDDLNDLVGNTPMGTTADTITGAIAELKNDIESVGVIETPILPDWFPAIPYPVKKEYGVWTFDDIDLTSFETTNSWKTYYVDAVNGSDENNGTTAATALKTLKAAITKYVNAGYPCRIIIADGSILYYPDLYGASFNLRKSLIIEAATGATIICGYSAATFSFTLNADEIYESTADISSLNIVAALDMGSDTLDDYGMHTAMTPAGSIDDVIATVGSYCIDGGKLYVNPYTSISNVVGLTSVNLGLAFVSSNPLDATSGIHFKNLRIIGNTSFSRSAHNYKAMFLSDNCIFENNPQNNNLTITGFDVAYLKNCIAGYTAFDGFNVAAGNMTAQQTAASVVVYANCKAKEAGYYNTNNSHNCNLNTAHTATNILRCGFIGYNADGPMIADVNGCYTVNYDVTVFNNKYDYTVSSKGAFEFNSTGADRATKQKCVDCFAYDMRAGYANLKTDGDIWIKGGNLMDKVGGGTLYPTDN